MVFLCGLEQQLECSKSHVEASLKFKLYQTSSPIIPLLVEKQQQEKTMNREVVRGLTDITFFVAKNCIAFRGHRENLSYTGHRGKCLNLTKIIAKYSPPLATYIGKLETTKKLEIHFTSNVSMDSTFDLSRKEQILFIIRYVTEDGNINDRLVALKDSPSTTGLIGQSLDGAQNRRGEYKGVQSQINDKCPTATFIWCCAHRLNLIVTKAVCCSSDAVDLFGNFEAFYNFISGSKKRVAYYEAAQKKYSTTKQDRHNETFEFEDIKRKRSRWKKKLSGQKECDEPILNPIQLFKVYTFLVSLDVSLNSINQYFNDDVIGIYKDLSLFSKRIIIGIKNNRNSMPEDTFEKLCAIYHKCLDRDLLRKEYLHFCLIYDKFENTKLLPTNLHAAASSSSTSDTEDEYEDDENLDEIFDFHKRKVLNPYNMDSMKRVFKRFQDSRLSGYLPTLNTSLLIVLTLPVTSATMSQE
ncbi:hypothetical protein QTP88_020282 [Uroleucon formosanum]